MTVTRFPAPKRSIRPTLVGSPPVRWSYSCLSEEVSTPRRRFLRNSNASHSSDGPTFASSSRRGLVRQFERIITTKYRALGHHTRPDVPVFVLCRIKPVVLALQRKVVEPNTMEFVVISIAASTYNSQARRPRVSFPESLQRIVTPYAAYSYAHTGPTTLRCSARLLTQNWGPRRARAFSKSFRRRCVTTVKKYDAPSSRRRI